MPSFTPYSQALGSQASVFVTVRFDRAQTGDDRFQSLPNVRCESYHVASGTAPSSAQFTYILDSTDPSSPAPYLFEQLWPLAAAGPYVVQADDELLVFEYTPAGDRYLVFDGFAVLPQINMGHGLACHFTAVGVGIRLSDDVIGGAVQRNADTPQTAGLEVETSLPTWFNPTINGKTRPNRTPTGYQIHEGDLDGHHCFLDSAMLQPSGTSPATPDFWTLPDLVYYLAWEYNANETYVINPVSATDLTLDDYLQSVTPVDGEYMDLADPSTYTATPIIVRSFDATGRPWHVAVEEQLNYYGFHVFLNTREDPDDPGAPLNELIVYRVDGRDASMPVTLWYPPQGSSLADGLPDFGGITVARDHFDPANTFTVESADTEWEIGAILSPGFEPTSTDVNNVATFNTSALFNATAAMRRAYRYFHFDEIGKGHWDIGGSSWSTTPGDFDAVFGAPDHTGLRPYVRRLRKGTNELLTLDSLGKPRKAELAISTDYTGPAPGLWDGTGTWRSLGASGWRLDDDGLGIWITADNPEAWHLPKHGTDSAHAGDVVRVITSLAGGGTTFRLRLTTVVKDDHGISATADKRDASPMRFAVHRRIEARDHWRKQVVHKSSPYNTSGNTITIRDDTEKAQGHAESLRLAREFPSVAGSVSIPWITHTIGIGDLIEGVSGRDVSFDTSAGGPAGEGLHLPAVVSISYTCQHPQTTVLKLTDHRADPESAAHGFGRSR